jgi:hypothetical protein
MNEETSRRMGIGAPITESARCRPTDEKCQRIFMMGKETRSLGENRFMASWVPYKKMPAFRFKVVASVGTFHPLGKRCYAS